MVSMPQEDYYISDAAAERLLHDLVAIPSPSQMERSAVEMLVHWMLESGYTTAYIDEAGNAVGIIGSGTRDVILLGHIDTFGGNPPARRIDRTLYGRGSVDAKGSLATFAVAALRANLAEDIRLIVVGAVEEEAASSKGARHIVQQFQPELCVIGEPSNWDRITLGYKGRLLLEWEWHGALAHSAGQSSTGPEHAIQYWSRVVEYTEHFNLDRTGIFNQLDVTLQAINSGQDGAYGWTRMTIGFRVPPGVDPEEIADSLQPDDDATLHPHGHELAVTSEKDHVLSRAFRGAIRACGGRPRFVNKTGTSDMNIVAPIWGCPIVAYGPGDSALDHTPDEHIDLDEYLQAVQVMSEVLSRV